MKLPVPGLPGAAVFALALLAALVVSADDEVRSQRVEFAAGESGTRLEGAITGYATIDYVVNARAGQTLSVSLATDHGGNAFNLIPPDADNEAVFIGTTAGNHYSGRLDLDGDWKIRVYLVRAAARRGETAEYALEIAVTGEAEPALAREANDFGPREWDARGRLGCAIGGQPMQTAACPFKVVRYRYEDGATIFVLAPGSGKERLLYFLNGEWSTDSAAPVEVHRRADLWSLVVSDEAYEVPDAVIHGG